jgi:hypothetical protein
MKQKITIEKIKSKLHFIELNFLHVFMNHKFTFIS